YVVHLDMSDLKEILRLMKINSNNLNQYTKKANETGNVYQEDINELLQNQKKLLVLLGGILDQLQKID
ncbi:MAG: plasmid mobilization relaxosome protein MobC, partial [Lachnospiraceae bacterium]|nr:plasmid mobilization relaxosome protein MobC [Lachnospiraceae bacterium]